MDPDQTVIYLSNNVICSWDHEICKNLILLSSLSKRPRKKCSDFWVVALWFNPRRGLEEKASDPASRGQLISSSFLFLPRCLISFRVNCKHKSESEWVMETAVSKQQRLNARSPVRDFSARVLERAEVLGCDYLWRLGTYTPHYQWRLQSAVAVLSQGTLVSTAAVSVRARTEPS